jgi:hypothetical protein
LNFYSERRDVFDDMDIAIGAMFAPFAALAVENELRAQEIDNLHTALQASRRIGVAIGILMARHLVTYEQAFAMLAAASQRLNRKLRDIAADVAETGELPGGSSARDPGGSSARDPGGSSARDPGGSSARDPASARPGQ